MRIICPHCEFANDKAYIRYEPDDGGFEGECVNCRRRLFVEDRGSALYVWHTHEDSIGFIPGVEGKSPAEISCPIGWSLVPDREHGVVLRSVFGERIDAGEVFLRALRQEDGFLLRGWTSS